MSKLRLNDWFLKLVFIFGFIITVNLVCGQEKICLPDVIVGKRITGIVYLNNGDTLEGEFIHLTPVNDIGTTHILYKSKQKTKTINRFLISAYYDIKKDEKRYKAYPDKDSVMVKEECRFDMGIFMLALVDGSYKLLQDELLSGSTIQAYNQSDSNYIYYLLTPDGSLIKLIRNDLKPQLQSIFNKYPEAMHYFSEPVFDYHVAAELIREVNKSLAD